MPRRVEKGDIRILPGEHRLLGEDGDPPLFLQPICIKEGVPVVHTPQLPDTSA